MAVAGGINYRIAARVLVNGQAYSPYSFAVDISGYSIATTIDARVPLYPLDGRFNPLKATDFGAIMQANRTVPIEIGLAYAPVNQNVGVTPLAANTNSAVPAFYRLESGYVDEETVDYGANEVWLRARSKASLFQDLQAGGDVNITKGLQGAKLVSYLAGKSGGNFTTQISPSTTFVGKKNVSDEYSKTFRLLSQWDYMQEAALADGYVLSVHNDTLYYGPPGGLSTPTVNLDWGRDLTECVVNHASRRSHKIKLQAHYLVQKTKTHGVVTAGNAGSGTDAESFTITLGTVKDRVDAQNRANAIFQDLIKREFLASVTLVPDEKLISTIAQYGANFFVRLGGVLASNSLLYHVKHVRVEMAADGDTPSVLVKLQLENHPPLGGGITYS